MNIIVTGSSKGIGFETVIKLCQKGHNVIAISRDKDKLNKLKYQCLEEAISGTITILPFDLESKNIESILVKDIAKYFSKIDALINNAGILINKPFEKITDEDFDRLFNIHVKSAFKLTKGLLPYFNDNAHIVNIGSMGGYQGSSKFPGLSVYSAAKGALAILTEALAEELKDRNVKINCLALGATQTEMLEAAFPGMKAPLQASEMATFICDFALWGHKFMNGKILPVSITTP